MTTDYNKPTDLYQLQESRLDTIYTESAFAQTTIPTNIHTANIIFTNIILMADKHNIPTSKIHNNCRLLPEDIVCKLKQRNNIRRENTCDPALKLLNEEITSDIQKHKQNIWKKHLDAHWDHRHNTHTLWKTIHGLSNRAPPHTLNTSITFNNEIATTPKHIANGFTKQFTNTVKHATHKTNRHINRATHNIQGYNITLTTSHVQEAIKNNNSQGPDKLNIRHLKHIGTLGLAFLTSMFKTDHNKNIIPHTWKLVSIVPIPKPNKDTDKGTSYRPISLLSVIAKTLEKSLLPYITANIPNTPMQHGYKTQHSTVTALHTLNNTVAKGFNQMAHPVRTITVALDLSEAFDTINIHTLIRKLLQTNILGTIIKFIANYIKERKAYTTHRNHTSKQRQFKTGVPQGGVLSPTQFNTSDLPPSSGPVPVMAYADDITITSTHTSTSAAKKYIQPYNIKFLPGQNKQPLTKSRHNNLHSVYTRPCRIYEQSGPNNKPQSTTHGNALKGSGFYLRPKTHIQHTHPQHLSTSTQTSTNHKSTHCNRMG